MNDVLLTLITFFQNNDTNEETCYYLYQEFPEYYVYLRKEQ